MRPMRGVAFESQPLSYMVRQVQADPSLAYQLTAGLDQFAQPREAQRVRFILHGAILKQLDENGLIEDIEPLSDDKPTTFDTLNSDLEGRYNAAVIRSVDWLATESRWEPALTGMGALATHGGRPAESDIIASLMTFYTGQSYSVINMIQGLNKALADHFGITSSEVILHKLQDERLIRRIAGMGLRSASYLSDDLAKGDPNRVLSTDTPPGSDRLGFVKPVAKCPVANMGWTAEEIDAQAYRAEQRIVIGCPALKGSRIVQKLWGHSVEEAAVCKLLGVAA